MSTRLRVAGGVTLDPDEIDISFIRAPGPGGQNVNKVATSAQLRFDLVGSPSLPAGLKTRAARLAGSRLTNEGEIVLTASRFRTQARNREDAVDRLLDLLGEAAVPPKPRRPTQPTLASKTRRLDSKAKRGDVKRSRGARPSDE